MFENLLSESFSNQSLPPEIFLFSFRFYERNEPIFIALVCFLCAFLLTMIPLAMSLKRQHRAALGNRSLFLDYFDDGDASPTTLSERSRSSRSRSSSSSEVLSERTHLLTLKDMYAESRKQEEQISRPRGRSIVMTSPEHDPFHLVPSATFDSEETNRSTVIVLPKSL